MMAKPASQGRIEKGLSLDTQPQARAGLQSGASALRVDFAPGRAGLLNDSPRDFAVFFEETVGEGSRDIGDEPDDIFGAMLDGEIGALAAHVRADPAGRGGI